MKLGYHTKQLILILGDLFSFAFAFVISLTIRNFALPTSQQIEQHSLLFGAIFILWIIINYINSLYDIEYISHDKKYYRRFAETTIISIIISVIFFYLISNGKIAPKTILLLNIFFGYGLSALIRFLYVKFVGTKRLQTNIILVGFTPEIKELINEITNNPEKGYRIVTLIDPDKNIKSIDYPQFEVFHGLHTIRPAITNYKANLVVVAPHLHQDENSLRELYQLIFWRVEITDLPSFYETITGRIPPSTFSESWFLDHLQNTDKPVYTKIRRLLDYLAALAIGITTLILLPIIIIGIKTTSRGSIFFKQKRVGQNGKIFNLYKFRSMYALAPDGSAEVEGWQFAKKQDKRITSFGKFIRKTRIDELPQAWNLFRGDITLIGPRPERPVIVRELESRMPYYPLRHIVRPGLTGWAVLHQHYTDTMETSLQKLQYDLFYIKNRSFLLDLAILLRTVNIILRLMGQ